MSSVMFFNVVKKHVSVPGMYRMPWNRRPYSLPKPWVQSGWRRGSFMRAEYSMSLLVTGWMTALAWCCCDQWLFPRAIGIWAVYIPQKSS
jgi:hypothetical protein